LTPAPTIQYSATPTSIYSAFPILSPANAANATEVIQFTKGGIGNAIWLPQGKSFIVSTTVGVYLYNATNGEEIRYLNTAPSPQIAISFDGKLLATGEGAFVRIWELETGKEIKTLNTGGKSVEHLVFTPDGYTLAADIKIEYSLVVQVWNVTTDKLLYSLPDRHEPIFSPDGNLLAFSYGGKIEILDAKTGKLLNSIQAGWNFAFSPNGDSIAVRLSDLATSSEVLFELLDIQTWQPRCKFVAKSGSVSLSFSPDGKQFAAENAPGTAQVWDTKSCQKLYAISGHEGAIVLAFSPNNQILASYGPQNQTLKLWDIATGKLKGTLEGFDGAPGDFSPDGQLLIERQVSSGTIAIWNIGTGKPVLTLDKHTTNISDIVFSPDGRFLATGHMNGGIRLWSLDKNKVEKTITYTGSLYVSIAFSPNGHIIAGGRGGGGIELWDVNSGKSLLTLKGLAKNSSPWVLVKEMAFSPDGKTLASRGTDSSVRLWDAETGQVKFDFTLAGSTNGTGIAFSPDGNVVAIATADKRISFRDVKNGQILFDLLIPTNSTGALKLVFSSDGHTLIASNSSTVWIWDVANHNLLATLKNAGEDIQSIALSPNGKLLAVSDRAGTDQLCEINLWDMESQKQLISLTRHTKWMNSLAFSPDGRLLASASIADGMVRIWGVKP
jgi:WD40 repeat protein